MIRLINTLFVFFVISTHMQAQVVSEKETLRRIYDQTTIMPMGKTFMKDGVLAKVKPFENPLKTELKQTPEAFDRFKKGTKQIYGGLGLLTLGLALSNASALSFSQAPDKESKVILLSTFCTGQMLLIGSTNKLNQAAINMQNAIWLHNRAQILNEARKNASLDIAKVAERYDRNTIQFVSKGFYQNGRYEDFGFLNKNLNTLMQSNALATAQLKKAKKNKIIATGLSVVGFATTMYSIAQNNSGSIYRNGWFWSGYSISMVSAFASAQSANQMAKAAWFYNRDAFSGN